MSALYACPMDGFQSETARRCPVCGMSLLEKDEAASRRGRFIEDPGAMMALHPSMSVYKWCQFAIMILGVCLISQPISFSYRSPWLIASDLACGAAAVAIAAATLAGRRPWLSYANALVGLWLMFAPLAFWAPDAAGYALDTLIGALLIAFSLVIPMSMEMPGPEVPPGWTYNPSSWSQRVPIVALGLVGFALSRAMAGYQLGHADTVWEPFFGSGTVRILESEVSKAWPVSDAGLGAMAYMVELLSTIMGDPRRWRTMPWMVGVFGLAVIPLGLASIILIIMQPLVVGEWCTLCLISAASMLLMIPLSLDEVVASVQLLNQSRKEGKSLWRVFWRGASPPGAHKSLPARPESWRVAEMLGGVRGTPGLYASAALGAWLMFSPAVFGSAGAAADSDHLVGALVITVAAIAWAEVGRAARFLNVALGFWLIAAPWLLEGAAGLSRWNSALAGALLIPLSLPLGRIGERYGSFDPWVYWPRTRSDSERASKALTRAVRR